VKAKFALVTIGAIVIIVLVIFTLIPYLPNPKSTAPTPTLIPKVTPSGPPITVYYQQKYLFSEQNPVTNITQSTIVLSIGYAVSTNKTDIQLYIRDFYLANPKGQLFTVVGETFYEGYQIVLPGTENPPIEENSTLNQNQSTNLEFEVIGNLTSHSDYQLAYNGTSNVASIIYNPNT
jgi:hypothetical protein